MNFLGSVKFYKICSLTLLLLLLVSPIAQSGVNINQFLKSTAAVISVRSRQPVTPNSLLQEIARSNVVYLGETHDSSKDHQAQLEIIQKLYQLKPDLVMAMEMFQRPFQSVLARYLAGDLTEAELITLSQYNQRWGFDWELYAPIVRFAKEKRLSIVALNTPTEVTRKVARSGLESLTPQDFRFIPPRSAIVLEPESYRERLRQIYEESHQGKTNSVAFDRFFQAQVLWDETMAERIAQILQKQSDSLVIALVGQGHLLYGDGIPSRVTRRLPKVSQVSILLNPSQELTETSEKAIADYFWYSQ